MSTDTRSPPARADTPVSCTEGVGSAARPAPPVATMTVSAVASAARLLNASPGLPGPAARVAVLER